jgi:hypothetical protein
MLHIYVRKKLIMINKVTKKKKHNAQQLNKDQN